MFKAYNLLTYKPVIYEANVAEDDLANDGADNAGVTAVREFAKGENSEVFVICAQIEQEIAELEDDEKTMFLEDLGLSESGLEKLIKASYHLLGLISYLTAGEDETRAWTIKVGTKAPQAAGKIHSDFERGFIKAEVVNYKDLLENGSLAAAREKGLVGMEGKEYVVKDGDVILFRFNVFRNSCMGGKAVNNIKILNIFRSLYRQIGCTSATDNQYINFILHGYHIVNRIYLRTFC